VTAKAETSYRSSEKSSSESTQAIEERLRRTVAVEQHITSSANDDAYTYWSCGEY